jgi:hypothetical protein
VVNIEHSAEKVSIAFGIALSPGPAPDGTKICSSDLVLKSSTGVLFSMALVVDCKGLLAEVIQQTDF